MDKFIHEGLQWCIDYNYCHVYAVLEAEEIVAMVALSYDSLILDSNDKEEMQSGFFPKPDISYGYKDTFWAKANYPALEITYLAVREDKRSAESRTYRRRKPVAPPDARNGMQAAVC